MSIRYLALTLIWSTAGVTFAEEHPDPAVIARGRAAFISSCGFCHGNDATGNRAPDLIRSPLVNRDENGTLIGPVILSGRPDKGMPGFPLSQQQMSDISTFLHVRVQESMNSASVPQDYPLEKLLTGNAAQGKAYFDGACASCHSATGDLAHVATKFSPIDLQSQFLYPRNRRPKPVTVTVKVGSSGPELEGPLLHMDEFDIAMRDREGRYHSWPRESVQVTVHDPLDGHRALLKKYSDADVHNVFAYLETLK